MEPFHVDDVREALASDPAAYHEFVAEESLSVGLYRVEAGATDPQSPHDEDEVYYVLSGRGTLRVGDEEHAVEPGSVAFVERGVDHQFVDVVEDLTTLVFFAPAHGTAASDATGA
jgi:mannose-6-phosphate isomerase-like protein (cupin superfamily)